MEGSQCTGCCHNEDGKCTRIGTNEVVGVFWIESDEGEY